MIPTMMTTANAPMIKPLKKSILFTSQAPEAALDECHDDRQEDDAEDAFPNGFKWVLHR